MEMNDNFLELRITLNDVLKMIMISSICMGGVVIVFIYIFHLFFKGGAINLVNGFFSIKGFAAFNLIEIISSLVFLIVVFLIGNLFFIQAIRDLNLLVKYHGIFFYMDREGIQFYDFDINEFKSKTWREFVDVGCYKQESGKILYKFQIKFTNGDIYNFDLRGCMSTKRFEEKVIEFYCKYG